MKKTKIYFAPAWGLSNKEMTDWYKKQTPKNNGIWENIISVEDINKCDFHIKQDVSSENLDLRKTIFFGKEPKHIANHRCPNCLKEFHHEKGNTWMPQVWWLDFTYDELMDLKPFSKTKNLSVINSIKQSTEGHRKRVNLINNIVKKYPNDIDVWGSITRGRENLGPYKTKLPPKNKKNGILPYKYHLTIENGSSPFYFSEKIVDPLLCWSMPIYWGCKNIDKFLPKGSYINIDINKKGVEDEIVEISKSNLFEENLNYIAEARDLMLNKYNLWPTIKYSLETDNILKNV
tara:strand:- start:656 stop:1525 length:870 start_codon:yes stop_codon:yes gene_type:complete